MIRATLAVLAALLLAGCTSPSSDSGPAERTASSSVEVAEPAPTKCTSALGAVDIDGDLLVPRGRTCRLEGTAVTGRVTVSPDATLIAQDSAFGEGISAHWFDRVELLGGHAEGRPKDWYFSAFPSNKMTDFVFEGGSDVVLRDGPGNGQYYLLDNTGRVEVVGLSLDLGRVYCAGNTRPPEVRGISAESPGVLQGQCAGLENFGITDF